MQTASMRTPHRVTAGLLALALAVPCGGADAGDVYVRERRGDRDVFVPVDRRLVEPPGPSVTVRFDVTPDTAVVVIDGAVIGAVRELAGEIRVAAGAHRVEVAAPGYATARMTIEATGGESYALAIRLVPEPAAPRGGYFIVPR